MQVWPTEPALHRDLLKAFARALAARKQNAVRTATFSLMQTGVPRGARERNSGEGEVTNHGRSDWALEKMRCDDGGLGGSFGRVNGASL